MPIFSILVFLTIGSVGCYWLSHCYW
jgi:hypothetical protein